MAYVRIIPRDLFNEGNLLKCLGQVYIELEHHNCPGVSLEQADEGSDDAFDIDQDESSGAITVRNVRLCVEGETYGFWRPMNSRRPYPLYLHYADDVDEVEVFTDEMLAFLARHL